MQWTVAIGVDTHKDVHVAVALDRLGGSAALGGVFAPAAPPWWWGGRTGLRGVVLLGQVAV